MNTIGEIGCADDGLWILPLEDCQKRRHTVNWKVGSWHETCGQAEEHRGHVCPPWFAPQFRVVSSSDVEAVAPNNEALQHYGQKVVYGHVTTNSVQITSDVMNVRKPFLITSALKLRGDTITTTIALFFRNETINVTSHDCHYHLHLTLANGIPHRKSDGDGWRERGK